MRWLILVLLLLAGCSLEPLSWRGPHTPRYAVYFSPDSAVLDDAAGKAIAAAAALAKKTPGSPITVGGFADPYGNRQANKDLAAQRAQAVADGLVADGVDAGRIHKVAVGVVDFSLDAIESRRVEITLGPP
jgi:membrane fusion protein (multidrug efflux system)